MSYTIVYAREFLKTNDGRIIPLVLSGCNNLWEGHRRNDRRVRSWGTWLIPDGTSPAIQPDELLAKVKSFVPSTYNEHFKRGGKWVDDAGFVRFFENGVKKALTYEELSAEALYMPSLYGVIRVTNSAGYYDESHRTYIHSSDEFDAFLDFADGYIRDNPEKKSYISIEFSGDKPIKRIVTKKHTKAVLKESYYVVKASGEYVTKISSKGLYHCPYIGFAKRFASEKLARKWIKERNLERRFQKLEFDVEYVA